MNRKSIRLILLGLLLSQLSFAQESQDQKKQNFWNRVSVGGNLGVQFGTVSAINISPEVVFRAVDQLHIGLGFSYNYVQANKYFFDTVSREYINYKENIWGGRIFARYYLRSLFDNFLGDFFVHAEYEYLYYTMPYRQDPRGTIFDPYNYPYSRGKSTWEINSLFLGGGYEQSLGSKAYMDILILYNFNETYYSPYSNPLFRIGFGAHL
ncbi:MAG: hypothetical protein NTW10_11285 [Bacteroidetes bacterium]|nr:hypothetical protein [Bacteroidota bacterium]